MHPAPYIYGQEGNIPYIPCDIYEYHVQEVIAAIDAAVEKAKEEVKEVKSMKELDSMLAVAAETGPVCPTPDTLYPKYVSLTYVSHTYHTAPKP